MINFNGNTPKTILFNGKNVLKVIFNSVEVWAGKGIKEDAHRLSLDADEQHR